MKIIDAKHVTSDKRARITGGLFVTFLSDDTVDKDDLFKLGNKNYFEAENISIENGLLKVEARETGYWGNRLKVRDLRNLIGLELVKVTSEDEIDKVYKESLWT